MEFNSGPTPSTLNEDNSSSFFRNATNYFVNGAVGSDHFDGTRNNPFETIGRAIMQSQQDSGPNSVVIAPGNYVENLIVNDFGGLLMRGEGSSPHDVVVNGNDLGAGLKIAGGSQIELENMSFKHGMNGIYAENADLLSLDRVVARGNSKHGLRSNNIGNVYVSRSNFLQNGYSGAKISRSETTEIGHAMFAQNADNGLSLYHNASVTVNSITASENGVSEEVGSPTYLIGDGDHGLEAFHNDQLEMRSSAFIGNRDNGIDLQSNHDVRLLYLEATANGENGFRGGDNQFLYVRNGKYNDNRGGDGISLLGPGVIVDPVESFERQDGNSSVRVVGSRLWDNSRLGFAALGYDEVSLANMNVQRSGFDGVNVSGFENVSLDRVRSTHNGEDGIKVGFGGNLTTYHLFSETNGGDGINVTGVTEMVNINHGNFRHNMEHGMRIDGDSFFPSSRVNIRHARAKENAASGLSIGDAKYGAIVGGFFSNNGYNGIELINAGRFNLEYVNAKSNYFDGLFSGVADLDDRIEPGSGNGDGPTLRGSLDIKQSSFNRNQSNGISIAGIGVANNNGGPRIGDGTANYYFSVNMDRVNAERNSQHGVFFGDDGILFDAVESFDTGQTARESGSATNVRFEADFNKGVFGHNGQDGIHADARGAFLGGFDLNLDADIQLDRVTANHNGYDGIDINIVTDQAYGGDFGSLVVVERAIAKRNGQNGLSLVGQGLTPGEDDEFQFGINAEIIRGVFNRNDQNGVYLRNLGDVFLDNPTGVANRDDGLDGSNIVNVFGDWTFVANGDQDFVLH